MQARVANSHVKSARSFIQYFEKVTSMIEKLSNAVSRYQEYEILLGGNQRFQEALGFVYYDALVFLKKAKQLFTARGSKALSDLISSTFTDHSLGRIQNIVQESLEEVRNRFPTRA